MICEYCEHEHPEDQIANPHYCVARLQEDLENARATYDDFYKEFKRLIAERDRLRENYNDLLMQLEEKYPNETRHETAKRYLKERGAIHDCNIAQAALKEGKNG